MKDTITLAMIVKDEAKNLKACLDSVKGQVDEIVIVDTGSTDNTLEIARNYTGKVFSYPWDGDFSAARNFAIAKAAGEWIFYLDADEKLLAGTGDLKQLIDQDNTADAYLLPLNNPTADATGEYNRFYVLRLFVNNERYRFFGKIHEQVAIPDSKAVRMSEGPVISHQMLPRKERNRKRKRNLALLKQASREDPENPFLRYYLGVEWMMLGKPGLALPYLRETYQKLPANNTLFRSPALRYLIVCLQALKRLDEAICLCLAADLKYPEYTDIYYLGGILFEEKQEYQLAIKWFNQAVRCGTPPMLYSHMHGAGSFLALYHLGYCHERLGQMENAITCYEQALESNPKYVYPVYSLFRALMIKYNPRHLLDYFKKNGYWGNVDAAMVAAQLFYAWGYPGLACQCLDNSEENGQQTEESLFLQGKYRLYSGGLEWGLACLDQIQGGSGFYIPAQILKVMGLFLQGRFSEGQGVARQLWKNREARCDAWVLLILGRYLEQGKLGGGQKRIREKSPLTSAREMYEDLKHYLPGSQAGQKTYYVRMVNGLETIMKSLSPEAYLNLLEHYRQKAGDIQSLAGYRFGNIGVTP
ncbi:glycosyl transferase [Clostridiales bacterium PH28_bin88]|nr:glycosyl transferase [Clostridiales bacterium PH28_bin88]